MKQFLYIILTAATALSGWGQSLVVAHRGYWNADGSAQNSRRALIKADSIECWGSEFDVWMTKDGVLFVNHDATINGIEIQNSRAYQVRNQLLPNGEKIPTLDELLDIAQSTKLQLVCELKPHDNKYQEAEAVKRILNLFEERGLQNRVTYITFSYPGMKMFIQQAPQGTEVYYLNGELSPKDLKTLGAAGPDYHYSIFMQHPEWIEQCKTLGLKTNAWTVNKREDLQWCIDHDIDFITTNEPELLQHLLKQ